MANLDEMSVPELEKLVRDATAAVEKRRTTHKKDVRKSVMELIRSEGLTLSDVFPELDRASTPAAGGKNSGPVVNPNNPDEVWHGKGRKPKWLTKALNEM